MTFASFRGQVAYLGPAGSWTHQATIDLFPAAERIPLSRDELLAAYASGAVEFACLPVTTSVVGITPYMDAVLAMQDVTVVAEYPKMLSYSLLVRPGTDLKDISEVFAHPVAFEEVRPWLERELPHVKRSDAVTGGAAAILVSESETADKGSFGPRAGATYYGLEPLVDGIEEGPHNVTRWWVLGRSPSPPTGRDKTSFVMELEDERFTDEIAAMFRAQLRVLTIYERPARSALDRHKYLIEVEGHREQKPLADFFENNPRTRVLGSYPRRY